MKKKIAVLGAGSWGSILASILVKNGYQVNLWARRKNQADELNKQHTNSKYIKDFRYPKKLYTTTNLNFALKEAEVVLFVVPTRVMRQIAILVCDKLREMKLSPLIIHASKGLELKTHKRMSQIIEEEIPSRYRSRVVALSGPSHAEEVAKKDLTLITAASISQEAAKKTQKILMNNYLRIYTNSDLIGVELGAAFKNIIALGAGALYGLGYGDDAKSALITRGLAEISRLGTAMGAKPLTFIGLSGVGDLIATCTSPYSRNWQTGKQLALGKNLCEIISNMGMVIEGINTCKVAYDLASMKHIEMPITKAIYNVLYKKSDIKEVISKLMQREGKSETPFESYS